MSTSQTISLRETLAQYGICDVADALGKLDVPQAGFLADIVSRTSTSTTPSAPLVAPVSTVLFVPNSHQPGYPFDEFIPRESNLAEDTHWTDNPPAGSVAVVKQPAGQVCAVVGDILATRLRVRGVRAVLVDGRVRDLSALRELGRDGLFAAWSSGTSVVTSGLETKPWAVDVPVKIGEVEVRSGDWIYADESEMGAIVVPRERVEELLNVLPALTKADAARVAAVKDGVSVTEAFRKNPK